MIDLDRHLRYLIRRYDCVTVPGLGAFIASYEPARYDAAGERYLPPRRRLGFNAEVGHSDGLLAASVAEAESVGCDRAAGMVAEAVETLLVALRQSGHISLPRIGALSLSNEAGAPLIFEPAADCAAADRYALLPAVERLPLLASSTIPSEPEADETDGAPTIAAPRHWRRAAARAVRVAASVAVVGALIWTASRLVPSAAEQQGPAEASLGVAAMPAPKPASLVLAADPELYIAIPAPEEAAPAVAAPATNDSEGRYCLVVASLPSRALAQKHIAAVGDPSLRILESEGRYRVYAATGATYAEALAKKADLAGRYSDAWVCRR